MLRPTWPDKSDKSFLNILVFGYSFFFTLAFLRRASFWPPSMVYVSVINTQTLQITFLHVYSSAALITSTSTFSYFNERPWAVNNSRLNKQLKLKLNYSVAIQMLHFSFLFWKIVPCRDLNPGPPGEKQMTYQCATVLP